jgi:hypothetical protein
LAKHLVFVIVIVFVEKPLLFSTTDTLARKRKTCLKELISLNEDVIARRQRCNCIGPSSDEDLWVATFYKYITQCWLFRRKRRNFACRIIIPLNDEDEHTEEHTDGYADDACPGGGTGDDTGGDSYAPHRTDL